MPTEFKETIGDLAERISALIDEEAEAQSNRECIKRFITVVCQQDEEEIRRTTISRIESEFGKLGFQALLEVFLAACESGHIKVSAEVQGKEMPAESPQVMIDHGNIAEGWFVLDRQTALHFAV